MQECAKNEYTREYKWAYAITAVAHKLDNCANALILHSGTEAC